MFFFFVGAWQLDILASIVINTYALDWTFYIPIGIEGWKWTGTALKWGDAYVIMFLIMAFGYFLPIICEIAQYLWNKIKKFLFVIR